MRRIIYDRKKQYKVTQIEKDFKESGMHIVYRRFANYIEDEHYYTADSLFGTKHVMRMLYINLVQAMYDGLDDKERNILIYACLYHDIGRIDHNRDSRHGARSWERLQVLPEYHLLIKEDFNEREVDIIRFLIITHSLEDIDTSEMLRYIEKVDREKAIKLLCILKDADSLDRTRFNGFDSKHLRTETAKKLVDLAVELNKGKIKYEKININELALDDTTTYKGEEEFTEEKFYQKIPDISKRMGGTCLYLIGLLYVLFKSNKVDVLIKVKIVGVLAYLISPLDFIPDILLFGFADDMTLILRLLDDMRTALDEEVRKEAKDWVRTWISEVRDSDFEIVDNIIVGKQSFSSLNKLFSKKKKYA